MPDRKPDRQSLIFVTIDCLRADHCGFMGYGVPTTPFLDQLAAQSFVFSNAIVAGVPTYYSFPAIMASRYPLALGREVLGLAPGEINLASVLRDAGYNTAFFGAANPYLSPQFGYNFGFDTFRDFLQDHDLDHDDLPVHPSDSVLPSQIESHWKTRLNAALANLSHKIPATGSAYDELYFRYCQRRSALQSPSFDLLRRFPAADVIVNQAEAWLSSIGDGPFFLWLHFMDPHAPYYPTEDALKLLGNSQTASRARYLNAFWNRSDLGSHRLHRHNKEMIAMYDAGIRWVDTQLARLVEVLRRSHRWENCIFTVTADHGEEFLDHDGRYHAPSLSEELIHVPLLIRVPGVAEPGDKKKNIRRDPFSLLHLAPTLLAAANAPIPGDFQGTNYWPNLQQENAWPSPPPAIAECVADSTNPFRTGQSLGFRQLAIREPRYKLILTFNQENKILSESLFDLEADPAERHPLHNSANRADRRRLLQAALEHLRSSHPLRGSDAHLRMRLRGITRKLTDASQTSNEKFTPAVMM
jgi:arylsulfatase A-like enzyme